MKNSEQQFGFKGEASFVGKRMGGFSLMELMVAMAMFLVVGGAAVNLFKQHVPLFTQQQNQTAVNVAMRNAAAQMQIDLANAGSGYYQGINIPAWPIGLTIVNPANGAVCYNAGTYGVGCFDTLNIISADSAVPPSNPTGLAGVTCNLSTAATLNVAPTGATTVAGLAALYKAGDEVLLVKSDGSQMTTVVLTAPGAVVNGMVALTHGATAADGSNAGDPMGIANVADVAKLGTQFCGTDWAIKLSAIKYSVDVVTNPQNPTLVRTQGNGQANTLADQIIGFKVGAWNTVTTQYEYSTANYNSDWSTIKSVRLSLIGRTNPFTGANAGYKNTFDNGPYKVEGLSIVVNPRNLSMN
jgi:Tfp pilus assembly protein PilW